MTSQSSSNSSASKTADQPAPQPPTCTCCFCTYQKTHPSPPSAKKSDEDFDSPSSESHHTKTVAPVEGELPKDGTPAAKAWGERYAAAQPGGSLSVKDEFYVNLVKEFRLECVVREGEAREAAIERGEGEENEENENGDGDAVEGGRKEKKGGRLRRVIRKMICRA